MHHVVETECPVSAHNATVWRSTGPGMTNFVLVGKTAHPSVYPATFGNMDDWEMVVVAAPDQNWEDIAD